MGKSVCMEGTIRHLDSVCGGLVIGFLYQEIGTARGRVKIEQLVLINRICTNDYSTGL